jgi:glucoamylase
LFVGDGAGFWVEVKRLWQHSVELAGPGVPAVRIVHHHERFELALRVTPCASRDVLLIEVSLSGDQTLKPYVLLAPHLGGSGWSNRAAVVTHWRWPPSPLSSRTRSVAPALVSSE